MTTKGKLQVSLNMSEQLNKAVQCSGPTWVFGQVLHSLDSTVIIITKLLGYFFPQTWREELNFFTSQAPKRAELMQAASYGNAYNGDVHWGKEQSSPRGFSQNLPLPWGQQQFQPSISTSYGPAWIPLSLNIAVYCQYYLPLTIFAKQNLLLERKRKN